MVSQATRLESERTTTPAKRTESLETLIHHDKDYIYINDMQINKDQFLYAFGGNLNPGKTSAQTRKFGNPAPAGLFSFGMACITLGLINMHAKGVTNASILIGSFLFSAGMVELVCAIWSIVVENTFAATVFFVFAGFWSAYGLIIGNAFGIQYAYISTEDLNQALGLLVLGYVFTTFLLWVCTLKSTWPFSLMFLSIFLFVLLYDIGYFTGNVKVTKAGGFFCTVSGLLGLYNGFGGLSDPENSYFVIQPLFMPGATKPSDDVENSSSLDSPFKSE